MRMMGARMDIPAHRIAKRYLECNLYPSTKQNYQNSSIRALGLELMITLALARRDAFAA